MTITIIGISLCKLNVPRFVVEGSKTMSWLPKDIAYIVL